MAATPDLQPTALLALDWGTSSLRGARIGATGRVMDERAFPRGILTVPAGGFAEVFDTCFGDWARDGAQACLISGMAGSKQGWVEAPYCACPAGFADVAAELRWVQDARLHLPTAIVPGLSCEHRSALPGLAGVPDVMRGEEVQILGAMHLGGWRDGLCILPGTHSKWAWIRDGRVTTFRSYMTGEFYALLSQQSLLARTIDTQAAFDADAFGLGLARAGQGGGLLHNAFSARTLSLFARMDAGPLASYLSGLVIGEELRAQDVQAAARVTVIGSPSLTARYALAFDRLGIPTHRMGAEASWAGLHALSHHLPHRTPSP
ncbi:MAG: 2-dehydro-3-deoxygalactonokinase [Rhodoferax sp.]|nr:2-dehydro-3-deoxygalactonokinase [Rhodoferax sp.]